MAADRCPAIKDGLQCVLLTGHTEPHQLPADPGWAESVAYPMPAPASPVLAPQPASTRVRRVLILVGLFFLYLPGWVVGVYLILKWTGLIRGMSHQNEMAAGWAIVSFVVVLLALASAAVLALGLGEGERAQADLGAAQGPLWLVVALVAAIGTFLLVRTYGSPRIAKNADWKGFWIGAIVAVVGISVSINSYQQAGVGGGTYVVAWGAVLVGGLQALRSLRRRPGASDIGSGEVPSGEGWKR